MGIMPGSLLPALLLIAAPGAGAFGPGDMFHARCMGDTAALYRDSTLAPPIAARVPAPTIVQIVRTHKGAAFVETGNDLSGWICMVDLDGFERKPEGVGWGMAWRYPPATAYMEDQGFQTFPVHREFLLELRAPELPDHAPYSSDRGKNPIAPARGP